jgi:hypothetical protein
MLVLTFLMLILNLLVFYFSKMLAVAMMTLIARYSYKSYMNYLVNKSNLDYMGFEYKAIVEMPMIKEQAPIIIEKTVEASYSIN